MSDTEPDPIVTRSITVYEFMDGDGDRWITVDTEGEPQEWDVVGMLTYALDWYRADLAFHTSDDD